MVKILLWISWKFFDLHVLFNNLAMGLVMFRLKRKGFLKRTKRSNGKETKRRN